MYIPVTICTLDNLPYEISPCFKSLVSEIGLKAAAQWTKEVEIALGKDDA